MGTLLNLDILVKKLAEVDCGMRITYWPSGDGAEISIISPAPAESFYRKRVYDIEDFIRDWETNMEEMKKLPLNQVQEIVKRKWNGLV